MASKSEGSGSASDADVATEPATDDGYTEVDFKAEAAARVAGAESRVEKAKAALAYAEETLANAKADQKEVN